MPFSIFRIRTITGSNLVGLLVGASLFAMFFFLSRYMQEVLGYSALKAGLSYLPLAIAIIVSAGIASVLVTKFGFKPILLIGMGLVTIALLWFGQVPVQGDYVTDLLGPMVIAAVGLGFAFVPVTIGADDGRLGGRVGAGLRADQHLPAGRRGARPRGARLDRELEDAPISSPRRRARRPRSRVR